MEIKLSGLEPEAMSALANSSISGIERESDASCNMRRRTATTAGGLGSSVVQVTSGADEGSRNLVNFVDWGETKCLIAFQS